MIPVIHYRIAQKRGKISGKMASDISESWVRNPIFLSHCPRLSKPLTCQLLHWSTGKDSCVGRNAFFGLIFPSTLRQGRGCTADSNSWQCLFAFPTAFDRAGLLPALPELWGARGRGRTMSPSGTGEGCWHFQLDTHSLQGTKGHVKRGRNPVQPAGRRGPKRT